MSDNNTSVKKEKRGYIYHNDKKLTEKSPDLTGKFLLDGKEWKISLWKNTSPEGKEYLSLSISEPPVHDSNTPGAAPTSQHGGQPILRPEPTPGAVINLSNDDLSDLDDILSLTNGDADNPFDN